MGRVYRRDAAVVCRCQCKICVNMPTVTESKCCKTTNSIDGKDEAGLTRITDHIAFRVNCLNIHVLGVTYYDHSLQTGPLEENQRIQEPGSLIRRHRTLLLVFLTGLVSVLNSVFIVHEYHQTYRNVSTQVKNAETPVVSRQILQVKQSAIEKISGHRLADRVRQQCWNNSEPKLAASVGVFSRYHTPDDTIQLCGIWKIGTTFMKRLFMLKNQKKYSGVHNLYDIPYNVMYHTPGPSKLKTNVPPGSEKFLFVRDPYVRVYSGFVDKVLAPNPVFWKFIGVPAVNLLRQNASAQSKRCGHDLTFKEYVDYVILTLTGTPKLRGKLIRPDGHFEIMHRLCKPCEVNYTFVGKMESFSVDSMILIRKLGLNKTEELLKENGVSLAVDDAIRDTVHQPFEPEFQKGFVNCMNKRTTLERAWLKLQARGLIGRQKLDMSDEAANRLTHEQFVKMAQDARSKSTSKERKEIKSEILNNFYDSVTTEKLESLRNVYSDDFRLFGYDDRPDWLFSRQRKKS